MEKMKLVFYLKKDKKNAEGNSAIYSKITIGKTTTTFSSGKYLSQQRWKDTNHLRNVIKKDNEIKWYLQNIEERANTIYLELFNHRVQDITALKIKSHLLGIPYINREHQKTVLQAIEFHNDVFATKVAKGEKSQGTLDRYKSIKTITKGFIKYKYNMDDLDLDLIDNAFVFSFDTYLRTVKTYKTNIGCGNNTTVKYIRNLRTIFSFIVDEGGWLEKNPFLAYKKRLNKVETAYLDDGELAAIENKMFDCERLNTVKNIFLFTCYTSYAPVDAMRLTWDNVKDDINGNMWVKTKRAKTNIDSNVPLLPPAIRIIKQYENDPRCANDKRLLPKLSNQKMNAYLKEIADLCGIKTNLTWYVARHTFATTVTLNKDVPLESVSAMMGHTNTRQTQHYAITLDKTVGRHMEKLFAEYA